MNRRDPLQLLEDVWVSPTIPTLFWELTLVAQCHASSHSTAVCGEFNEEAAGTADQTLDGQVLHLVRVVYRGCLNVVPIADN